ncbi:TonB superfamily domain protein [Candidatus Cyrtobacter comes]|uniref:TonB superfamily domain protein n=1 Tax=Candidatus Cyrtobacter comes TaxID=675776 RepID=A0ABU5L8N4_9RICK|nr:hypothetical protein [Candidatus Cyrtobacter comes]MDZ5762486.1 TonB superfamily domain protein [Candidatus Cyrtobacter comes]
MYKQFLLLLKKKTDKLEMLDISFIISFFAHLFFLFAILVKSFSLEKTLYDNPSSSVIIQVDEIEENRSRANISVKKIEPAKNSNVTSEKIEIEQKSADSTLPKPTITLTQSSVENLKISTPENNPLTSTQSAPKPDDIKRKIATQKNKVEKKTEKKIEKKNNKDAAPKKHDVKKNITTNKPPIKGSKDIKENKVTSNKRNEKNDKELKQKQVKNVSLKKNNHDKQSIIDEILADKTSHDEASNMTGDEVEAIRSQIRSIWNPVIFGTVDNIMYVKVVIRLSEDGSVIAIRNIPTQSNNTSYSAFLDSVIMAIANASPISGLSPKKFSQWKEIELTFSSEDI